VTPHLTQEQDDLARTVRSVLERQSGSARVRAALDTPRGYDEKLWSVLCEQVGVAALAVPERHGGLGAGVRELQIVAEELGRGVTPSPLLGSAVLATAALLAAGDDAANERLLPGLAEGAATAALAWTGPTGDWSVTDVAATAVRDGDGYRVDGDAHYVLDGDYADVLLVAARAEDGLGLFEVSPAADDVTRAHTPTMDLTRHLAAVTLTGARAVRLGGVFDAALAHVRDVACAVLSAEQVGAAAQALAITVEYTKNRRQFGRAIGSFQALKHRMADLHVLVETARSTSYAAGAALDAGEADAARAALVAKVYCSQAFSTVAAEMIQLHGGIGITWEHDAHLYFKRAHSAAHLFGMPHQHLARFPLTRG
jgi:alkylation response protein AidB-like acyl-CoA dehydrogenase